VQLGGCWCIAHREASVSGRDIEDLRGCLWVFSCEEARGEAWRMRQTIC
jgi:hypothetical protein